jgi:hypothetical protein
MHQDRIQDKTAQDRTVPLGHSQGHVSYHAHPSHVLVPLPWWV